MRDDIFFFSEIEGINIFFSNCFQKEKDWVNSSYDTELITRSGGGIDCRNGGINMETVGPK